MNYTGMLAEVTGGVEKLPAAKALGLDVMLKTRHCGLSWLPAACAPVTEVLLPSFPGKVYFRMLEGNLQPAVQTWTRRNSANSLHVLCRLEERLRPWRHLY